MFDIDPRRLPPKATLRERVNEFYRKLPAGIKPAAIFLKCDGTLAIHSLVSGDEQNSEIIVSQELLTAFQSANAEQLAIESSSPLHFVRPLIERFSEIGSSNFKEGAYILTVSGKPEDFELGLEIIAEISPAVRLSGFPGVWELFGFLLDSKTRQKYFEPAFHDLMADYLRTRASEYQTPFPRAWLNFCFTARTILLVMQSLRAAIGGATVTWLISKLAPTIRQRAWEWWHGLFH